MVPQGTTLGPLCFLVLINDALTDTPSHWKYVDDSTIASPILNSSPDYTSIQSTINNLNSWTTNNDVTINPKKTVVMHFNLSKTPLPPPPLTLNGQTLDIVTHTKLLGVTIDNKLTWNKHVDTIINAASYKLYMLRRLKSLGVPPLELTSIYKQFILPKLMYASPAWSSSLGTTQLHRLEKTQKRAFKIILGPSYNTYDEALNILDLTTLANNYQNTLVKFSNKLLNNPRHRHLLPPSAPPPRHATRSHNLLVPIRARTNRYKNSPIPTIVNLINSSNNTRPSSLSH